MSEYQYYEFQAIDRPLTTEELSYVRRLSRRVQATSTHAAFTYSYGDFPGDPLKLLAKQYDVMLYLANWGSKQIAFRFPRAALDEQQLSPYYYGSEEIELTKLPHHLIVSIAFDEEEPEDWIEGEGLLPALAPLREDMLRGDLRALYLAWLKSATYSADAGWDDERPDVDEISAESLSEPPVPAGLGQLTAPLQALIEFLDLDCDLVAAAAQASPSLASSEPAIEQRVSLLPEAERNAFLARVARGERIEPELLRRLRELGGETNISPAADTPRRTFAAILSAAQQRRQARRA